MLACRPMHSWPGKHMDRSCPQLEDRHQHMLAMRTLNGIITSRAVRDEQLVAHLWAAESGRAFVEARSRLLALVWGGRGGDEGCEADGDDSVLHDRILSSPGEKEVPLLECR